MQSDLFSLSRLFTETLYRIPDYQRGYAWTERQLKDFWSDLLLLTPNTDHYTGVLTLEPVPAHVYQQWEDDLWIISSKRYTPYYVVDGQQRLTTSLILLQSILETVNGSETLNYSTADEIRKKYIYESRDGGISRSYLFGYEKDNPSYEFLKTSIFQERSDDHSTGEPSIYTHNLEHAKKYFHAKLSQLTFARIEEVFVTLTQQFLFNIYAMGGGVDVFVAFETMNNRGKPLSHLELMKNRLIFLSTRLPIDSTDKGKLRRIVNESWKTLYHYIGRNKNRPLVDDAFLRDHCVLYFGPRIAGDADHLASPVYRAIRDEDTHKTFLLDFCFTSANIQDAADPALSNDEGFAGFGMPRERVDAEVINKYSHDIKTCVEYYYYIHNPSDSALSEKAKTALSRLNRLGWSPFTLPLALSVMLSKGRSDPFIAFDPLERMLFLRTLQGPAGESVAPDLIEMAIKLRARKMTISQVAVALDAIGDKICDNVDTGTFMFEEWINRRGYYQWRGIRYFLFEYELELKRKCKSSRSKLDWDIFCSEDFDEDYVTVEHIYPQSPSRGTWSGKFGSFSQKQRRALRDSLGNLVALSRPKNSSLGNRSFHEKKAGTAESPGYCAGSYSEIEVAKSDDWGPEEIVARGVKMLKFMEKRWKFDLGSDGARLRKLGLDFMATP